MWLYSFILTVRAHFPYWLMGLLIAEGLLGLALMFVFPPGALGMVFLGLLTLLLSGLVRKALDGLQYLVGRIVGVTPPPSTNPLDPPPPTP